MTSPACQRCRMCMPAKSAIFSLSTGEDGVGNW